MSGPARLRHMARAEVTAPAPGRAYVWRVNCPDCGDLGITSTHPEGAMTSATDHYWAKLHEADRAEGRTPTRRPRPAGSAPLSHRRRPS